jgi:hypothetical protein
VELSGTAGKFALVPARDENQLPGFRPGEHHLSAEWRQRQAKGDIEFQLYWIPFVDEDRTPAKTLTEGWEEDHKQLAGSVRFPQTDPGSAEARSWAVLASEMGANPGNWIHDRSDSIREPATEFGTARKIAYQLSQAGRGVLEPDWYRSVFETGAISPELAAELQRRQDEKDKAGHVSCAPKP